MQDSEVKEFRDRARRRLPLPWQCIRYSFPVTSPQCSTSSLQVQDSEGKEVRDGVTGRGGGYRYFGAAKQLPGVKELFEKEPPRKVLHMEIDSRVIADPI